MRSVTTAEARSRAIRDLLLPGIAGHMTRRFGPLWHANGYSADLVIHNDGLVLRICQLRICYNHPILSSREIAKDAYRDLFAQRMTWLIEDAASYFRGGAA